jgi:DNA-binding NarL/FixJ family response regulator
MDTQLTSVWVDDTHAIFRRGMVASLIADGFLIRGESTGLRPTPRLHDVDVFVFDCIGPSLRQAVRLAQGSSAKLVATVHEIREPQLCEIVQAGVAAVLLHSHLTPDVLVTSLRAVSAGAMTVPQDLLPRLLLHASKAVSHAPGGLSPRETDVLRLLADGLETREIARSLCFSERTVKNVVHDILMKLNCRTRAHAVAFATRSGVI